MITVLSLTPSNGQNDVSPSTAITAAVLSSAVLGHVSVTLDGVLALSDGVFTYPGFSGSVVAVGTGYIAFTLQPRRSSSPGEVHTIALHVTDSGPSTLDVATTYRTADQITPLVDLNFRNSVVDKPFTTTPALDVFRSLLVSATRTRPSVAAIVQMFYRVYFSDLRAYIANLQPPVALVQQLTGVLPADVASVISIDTQLQSANLLWDIAVGELISLGATPDAVQPLQVAHNSSYPQERVAAASAAVLYAATFHP
jgi:hypothetical protein